MVGEIFSIRQAVSYGWREARKNLEFYVPALIVVVILNVGLGALQDAAKDVSMLAYVLFNCLSVIISSLVALGFFTVALDVLAGQKAGIRGFFERNYQLVTYLIASFFYSMIIFGGILLLVIPGIIWAVRFRFFGYYMIDQQAKPLAALRASLAMTRGYTVHLLKFFLVLLGINLLGVIPLGLGLFVTIPTSMIASAYVYKKLSGAHKDRVTD